MSTRITCYGGVNEIGGNKILLEDDARRLFFDFGKAFGRYSDYFDGVFIKDRVGRGLLDPLSLGLIPALRGVLRDDLVPVLEPDGLVVEQPGTGRRRNSVVRATPQAIERFWQRWDSGGSGDLRRPDGPAIDLVLISHAHQDHISDLEFVSPGIPAASTRMTAFISKVLLDTSNETSGAPYVSPREPREDGLLKPASGAGYVARPWCFLDGEPAGDVGPDPLDSPAAFWATPAGSKRALTPRKIGLPAGMRLRHWPVDHSIFGATGLAVETQAGWVGYSGDLRFHGKRGRWSTAFAEGLAQLEPQVLLCEGTRLSEPNRTSEEQVTENCLAAARSAAGRLLVADFAPRNVERLETFLAIAEQTQRIMLVQPRDAFLLRALYLAGPLPGDPGGQPSDWMASPWVGLYEDPKLSTQAWEQLARERYAAKTFGAEAVRIAPGGFILAFSLTDVVDMLDIRYLMGARGEGMYIFSNSKAYDEEQKVDLVRLWNWTQLLGLQLVGLEPDSRDPRGRVSSVRVVPGYHSSGHAGAPELADFVRTVRPKVMIPIHTDRQTEWAGLLEGSSIEVRYPTYGMPIELG